MKTPSERPVDKAPSRPRILVIGDNVTRVRSIVQGLENLQADIRHCSWRGHFDLLHPRPAALVVADPISVGIVSAISTLRAGDDLDRIPIYAVVLQGTVSRAVRDTYAAGASAVVEWPREKKVFASIVAEIFGMSTVRGRASGSDNALGRTVRAHLRLGPSPGKSVRISTQEGIVRVSGQVHSLIAVQNIVETIAAVPGVKQVNTSRLFVAPSEIPDRVVKKDIDTVIRAMSEIDPEALRVTVLAGRVVLRGTIPNRASQQRLLELIAHIKGVRDLDWKVTLARSRSRSDSNTAHRLRRAISALYREERIGVRVFAGIAVLTGTVSSLAEKRAIERLVARDDGVERVVNKLLLRGS